MAERGTSYTIFMKEYEEREVFDPGSMNTQSPRFHMILPGLCLVLLVCM